jgi:type III secretory pathway component EscR
MTSKWKRPKTLDGKTAVVSLCGNIYVTFNYDHDRDGKLVEVRATVGKGGTPCNILLTAICFLISCYLQSPEPRYKIIKKLKKNLLDAPACMQSFEFEEKTYTSCFDYILKNVVKELEVQVGDVELKEKEEKSLVGEIAQIVVSENN